MTTAKRLEATNLITGCGVLGFGFDIFGSYSEDSVLRPMMNLGHPDDQWVSPAGVTFDVPGNVSLNASTGASGTAYAFAAKENFVSHFASKANVKGSYGAFAGEFEASFATDTSSESQYSYGLYEELVESWALTLQDWSSDALLPTVTKDPDFTSLPLEFTQENQYLFFRFFAKYGTHFISRVDCGARMSYTVAVSKSYTSSTTEVSVKLTAEFQGVFGESGGNAQADFKVADQRWFDNRQVTVRTIGGDTSLVAGIAPAYGVNDNAPFESWLKSAEKNPAPISFQLAPVSALFSGKRAAAVQAAYAAYANSRLYSEARDDGSTLLLSGVPLVPAKTAARGATVAVLDTTDLNVALLQFYPEIGWPVSDDFWSQMAAALAPYAGRPQYVLALTLSHWTNFSAPRSPMVTILKSCGAGTGLDDFLRLETSAGRQVGVTYTLLGVMGIGPGLGIESFEHGTGTSGPTPAVASGLLVPVSADNGEDQFQFQLLPV